MRKELIDIICVDNAFVQIIYLATGVLLGFTR